MAFRTKYLVTVGLPIALAATGIAWKMGWGLGTKSDAAVAYDSVEASHGEIRRLVNTSGPVRAVVTVSVGSQLSGRIDKLSVDFNSEVKEGDLLARLEDKTFAARVAQARADLVAAQAGLTNQQAARAKAEAVLRNAKRLLERQETLATKGVASTATLDNAVIDAQIENAKATISQREASLLVAQLDLDRSEIRSPIDGTVISRTVDIGQTVAASLQAPELFKIAQDLRRIQIEAQVNEADVGAIKEGNPVEFTVDAFPDERFDGKVTQVRLAATELQSVVTYTVIIEAANDDRRLFPGMTANVQIETAKKRGILRISNDSLRFKPRDQAIEQRQQGTSQAADRGKRVIDQLKSTLKLNDEQVAAASEAMRKAAAERVARRQGDGPQSDAPPVDNAESGDRTARNRFMERIEAAIEPTLSAEQKVLLERWQKTRKSARMGTVWVLGSEGKLERRMVRLGINDEQHAEVLGGGLKAGDKVITRTRQTGVRK